ncbi:ABC transporter permease [Tistrella sp.]|uniref:Iron ABC transporter permease n=1 Tax=Tistrella mobilis TaxID=171437 RepID=A0A3B9IPC4_9PROT|nr:iron ABC transporter permease [Tistrella sp.]MAD38198.1 inner membrane component of ABC transporter [Tistrella sp.]HAE49548.1 iron ABC transporter permease [Tistrella mobilis]
MRGFPVWTVAKFACLAVLAAFVAVPLFRLFALSLQGPEGWSLDGYRRFFATPALVDALVNTVTLGIATALGALLLGLPLAFAVARLRLPCRGLLALAPLATFVLPDIIVTQSWLMVFGNNGLVTNLLHDRFGITLPGFYGWTGLVFVMVLQHYGYVYLLVLAAFRGIDRSLEEAATVLGSGPGRVWRTVTARLLLPPVATAALIVFTLAVDNFGVPVIVAPRVPVLSVAAYNAFVSEFGGGGTMQATMSVVLVALVALALILQKGLARGCGYQMEAGRAPVRIDLPAPLARLVGGGLAAMVLLSLLPVAVVAIGAFTHSIGPVLHWGRFSLGNFASLASFGAEAMRNSFGLATLASIAGVLFGTVLAWLSIKKRSGLTHLLDYLGLLPLAVSGTVLGIALINTWNGGWFALTGGWVIMAIAYFIRRMPYAVNTTAAAVYQIRDSIEEASISLGVPPGRSFLKVVLPLLRPAMAGGAVFIWVTTLSELSATIVLYSPGLTTMPIQIYQQIDSGYMGPASAYSLILLLSIFLPLWLATRIFGIRVFATD